MMIVLECLATIAGALSLPLVLIGLWELSGKWGEKLRNFRRPIGIALLVLAALAYALDMADRFGAFGPTRSELSWQLAHRPVPPKPKVMVRTVTVQIPVPDPAQATEIQTLKHQHEDDTKTIAALKHEKRQSKLLGVPLNLSNDPLLTERSDSMKPSASPQNPCMTAAGTNGSLIGNTVFNKNCAGIADQGNGNNICGNLTAGDALTPEQMKVALKEHPECAPQTK